MLQVEKHLESLNHIGLHIVPGHGSAGKTGFQVYHRLESCLRHLKRSSRNIQAGLVRYRDQFVQV